jgi:lipopolysaccharide transport system ATP-binding protein
MSDLAIRVESIAKQYAIGLARQRYDTLRDALMGWGTSLAKVFHASSDRQSPSHNPNSNHIWALQDVSFVVNQGEVLGIIGANGAGKSTLLKILSRITEPTRGQVAIYGRVASLLEVGTGFHQELTGRENIYFNGALLGMRRAEIQRKFDEMVAFAGVEKFIDTPVKHYSSGMQVRLAFAVAAHLEPEILLVDEVLAVGDAAFQRKCLGKMEDVVKAGRTVLFVSHNMAAITNLCQRAIVLSHGRVGTAGEPGVAIEYYLAEISNTANTALSDRTDRQGLGEMIIRTVELLDPKGDPIEYAITGQTLIIRLYYQSKVKKIFQNANASVTVWKDERILILCSTDLVDTRQMDLYGDGYIDFVIPDLPLSGSTYYLTTYLDTNGLMQDWVLRAAKMSVIDGDFYGTGKNYPPGWQGQVVLVKHSWRLESEYPTAGSTAR